LKKKSQDEAEAEKNRQEEETKHQNQKNEGNTLIQDQQRMVEVYTPQTFANSFALDGHSGRRTNSYTS
jgi:hypothetical protein